jgi:hypothetical protein
MIHYVSAENQSVAMSVHLRRPNLKSREHGHQLIEVGLQKSDSLWPARLTSAVAEAFGSKDKVSRVHITPSSGSEQDDDYDDSRSNVDEDKTLSEGCEGASIQAINDPDDN